VNRIGRFLGETDLGALRFYTMPKFDGLAVELVYEQGRLALAATRGDGVTGENVTANALTIADIPAALTGGGDLFSALPSRLTVRGEVYMEKAEFARLNQGRAEEGLALFANPRNAAAGALRQLEAAVTRARQLKFFAYGLAEPAALGLNTYGEVMDILDSWGHRVEKSASSGGGRNLAEVLRIFDELARERDHLPYEIDGLVVTLEDLARWDRLGSTARAPRYAVAAKFKPRLSETRVLKIEIQVGRTGVLTPVARLEPTLVGGVTVSNATLHNEDELQRKDVRPGDTVLVRRAGEVIPEVLEVVLSKRPEGLPPFVFPDSCPICGAVAVRRADEVARRCPNPWCPAQIRERFLHFAGKNALDIAGLGDKLVDLLLSADLVRIPTDLYRLSPVDLERLPRLGKKSALNLAAALEKSKIAPLWRFIHALGIRHVGERTSQILADRFPSLAALSQAPEEELTALNEIGPEVAGALLDYFRDPLNEKFLADLTGDELGIRPAPPETAPGSLLAGRKFVLTGSLTSFTRAEAKARLAALGAQVLSAVSQETDYVVAGEAAGGKLTRALELSIPILSEAEFLKLIQEARE
jgi:DNA ligase (NAD+)